MEKTGFCSDFLCKVVYSKTEDKKIKFLKIEAIPL